MAVRRWFGNRVVAWLGLAALAALTVCLGMPQARGAPRPPEPNDPPPPPAPVYRWPPRPPEPTDAEVRRLTAPPRAPEPSPVDDVLIKGGPLDREDLRLFQEHVVELTRQLVPCTVGLAVGQAQGSGVIISPDGFVLTAGHVSGTAHQEVMAILHTGRIVRARTLGANRVMDSGLVKLVDTNPDGGDWPHVEMGHSHRLRPGQWCLCTGHPGGYQAGRQPVLRLGRVLAVSGDAITSDCTLVGGDSGGPLFDLQGRVIGIHSRIGGPLTANFHVPVDTYRDTWQRLVQAEVWGRGIGQPGAGGPFVGMVGDPAAENCKIAEVLPDSPAAKAGIQVGDVVKSFAGEPIRNFSQLREIVGKRKPGETVKIEIVRAAQTMTLELVIGTRPG